MSENRFDGTVSIKEHAGFSPKRKVLIIDGYTFRRTSLELMLRLHAPDFTVASVGDIVEGETRDADVILFAVSGIEQNLSNSVASLRRVQQSAQNIPVAVYSDVASVPIAHEMLSASVRGIIWTSMEVDLVLAAIRLICAGGTFVPRDVLVAENVRHLQPESSEGLTRREEQILDLVRRGKPNKVIAHALGIAENTVKVHLHKVMRKLKVNNRTEVALHGWAAPMPVYQSMVMSAAGPS